MPCSMYAHLHNVTHKYKPNNVCQFGYNEQSIEENRGDLIKMTFDDNAMVYYLLWEKIIADNWVFMKSWNVNLRHILW